MEMFEAMTVAGEYSIKRPEVRAALIKGLREIVNNFPTIAEERLGKNELRKIRLFPSDLSEDRLCADINEMRRQEP